MQWKIESIKKYTSYPLQGLLVIIHYTNVEALSILNIRDILHLIPHKGEVQLEKLPQGPEPYISSEIQKRGLHRMKSEIGAFQSAQITVINLNILANKTNIILYKVITTYFVVNHKSKTINFTTFSIKLNR